MPSETFHETHQGPQKSAQERDTVLERVPGWDRQKNVRERIQFDEQGRPIQEFSDPGALADAVDPDHEAEHVATDGPRRVRYNPTTGATERLTKNDAGALDWETKPAVESLSDLEKRGQVAHLQVLLEESKQKTAELEMLIKELSEGKTETDFDTTPEEALAEQEDVWKYDLTEEIKDALDAACDKYARETAKSRASLWGGFLHNSTKLVAIPGIRKMANWLADKVNSRADKDLETAREEYTTALKALQQDYVVQVEKVYEESEELTKTIRIHTGALVIESEELLHTRIINEQLKHSGKTSKLADWWVRQEGTSGKWKRAGIVAGVAATGVGLGLVGSVALPLGIAGGIIGAGVGAATGLRINKKRAGVASGLYVAREAHEDLDKKVAYIQAQQEAGEVVDIDHVTSFTESRTADTTQANRLRTFGLTGAALAGAAAGIIGGSLIKEAQEHAPVEKPSTKAPETPPKKPETATPATPEIPGQNFTVEHGGGFTSEIQQFAETNGKHFTDNQAYSIYEQLEAERGPNNLIVGQGVYPMGGANYGIASSGPASWAPGVAQRIEEIAAEKGIW